MTGGARGVRLNYPRDLMIAPSRRLHDLGWNMEFFGGRANEACTTWKVDVPGNC